MDLKSLIAKMDQIEKKQILKESVESAAKEIIKETAVEIESKDLISGIAKALLSEFDLEEGPLDSIKAWNQKNIDAQAAKDKAEADMANPANIEAFKKTLTPSQLKWVGNADLSDPIIRSRIPKPQPGEKPAAATAAASAQDQQADMDASSQGKTPASDLAKANAQDQQADMDASSQGATPTATAQAAQKPAADAGAKGSKPVAATATSQEKMDRFVYLMNKKKQGAAAAKPLELPPGAAPEPGYNVAKAESLSYLISKLRSLEESLILEALTPEEEKELQVISKEVVGAVQSGSEGIPPEVVQAVNDFQAGSTPAAKAAAPSIDPEKLKAYQTKLGVTADGKMGPQTAAAVKKFQQDNNLKADGIIGPQTMAALDKPAATSVASQSDVRKVDNQIAAAQQASTATQTAAKPAAGSTTAAPTAAAKPAAGLSRTTSGTLIANEPVIPGQPLSDRQMRVMRIGMDMGNKYSPEIMAQYNKQQKGG